MVIGKEIDIHNSVPPSDTHPFQAIWPSPPKLQECAVHQHEERVKLDPNGIKLPGLDLPFITWQQKDCNGPAAKTESGKDIESIALSQIGQHIDDGYGDVGCVAAVAHHILVPHLQKSNRLKECKELEAIINCEQLKRWARHHSNLCTVTEVPQQQLTANQLQPGDILVGQKITSNHCLVAARFPTSLQLSAQDIVLLANTGHFERYPLEPQYAHFQPQEMIINPQDPQGLKDVSIWAKNHGCATSNSPNNPYNIANSTWTIIRFKDIPKK